MDFTAEYCPVRKRLEERSWFLTSRLAALTARLLSLTGHGHEDFLTVLDYCQTARLEVTESHSSLQEHRQYHGC